MVVLKRKASGETERGYEGYDSVIELDDRKSFAASQKEVAEEPEIYTPREAFVKPREEVMPSIKRETKPAAAPAKQAVSAKAKVLLAAYIIIAVVLAAIVIGTGLALTEIGERNADTFDRIYKINRQIDEQREPLAVANDSNHIGSRAQEEFEMVSAGEIVEVTLIPEKSVASYGKTTNWFDRLCDWLSNLFN